jgi:hypothetical protein
MITIYAPASEFETKKELPELVRLSEIVDRLRQKSTEFKLPIPPQSQIMSEINFR